jgi:hypothetical protein
MRLAMNGRVWKKAAHAFAGAVAMAGSVVGFTAFGGPTAASGAAPVRALSLSGSIDFGSVTLGDFTSRSETVTNMTAGELTVVGDTASGANPQDFSTFPDLACPFLDSQADIHLPPGGSCNLNFYFFPSALGTRSATLTLVESNGNSLASVGVSGTGAIGYYQVSSAGAVANFGTRPSTATRASRP